MASLLDLFQSLTGSYGIAIVLLTLLVRLLLYPLSHKQMVSMAQMQKIQPRLKHLQEKYANDKEALNREMMRLYKEHNVNPLAGCFPILVQIPIMILLFRTLMNAQVGDSVFLGVHLSKTLLSGMAQALRILPEGDAPIGLFSVLNGIVANPAGLANVSLYLPTLLFILAIAFLTWFQQKMSGAASNPQMATMNVVMPIMMGFICLSLPGGVLVYWGTSSLIGILQQWVALKRTKAELEEKPTLYRNKPVAGQKNETLSTPSAAEEEAEYDDDEYEDDEYEEYEDDDEYEDDEEYVDEDGQGDKRA